MVHARGLVDPPVLSDMIWLQSGAPGGYGVALLQTLLALGAVSILAWVVLRWSARRGLGVGRGRRVKVLERTPLDGRRALYLVSVGDRVLLLQPAAQRDTTYSRIRNHSLAHDLAVLRQ